MQLFLSRWAPGPLALLLTLPLCACSFDATGLTSGADGAPSLDGPPVIDLAPRIERLAPDDLSLDSAPAEDLPLATDTTPKDTQPHDTQPPHDTVPVCGPGNCAGCCTANTCRSGKEPDACGAGGGACTDCFATKKVCGATGSCTGCANGVQCPGDTFCLNPGAASGLCEPAYGRAWRVNAYSAEIGKSYDSGSDPDAYAKVTVGSKYGYTKTIWDNYKPTWNQYVSNPLNKTTKVMVEVWDKDNHNSDDYIGKFEFASGVPISVLKAGEHAFTGGPGAGLKTLVLKFKPEP
jgi:hypothetical protein